MNQWSRTTRDTPTIGLADNIPGITRITRDLNTKTCSYVRRHFPQCMRDCANESVKHRPIQLPAFIFVASVYCLNDLALVMPMLGILTGHIKPILRHRFARPCHRENGLVHWVKCAKKVSDLLSRPLQQIDQDSRAEPISHVGPVGIQLVQK